VRTLTPIKRSVQCGRGHGSDQIYLHRPLKPARSPATYSTYSLLPHHLTNSPRSSAFSEPATTRLSPLSNRESLHNPALPPPAMKRSTSSSPAPILDAAITLTPSPKKPKKSPFGGSGTSRSNSIPSPSHKARIPPPQKTALARAIIMAGLGAVKVDELAREVSGSGLIDTASGRCVANVADEIPPTSTRHLTTLLSSPTCTQSAFDSTLLRSPTRLPILPVSLRYGVDQPQLTRWTRPARYVLTLPIARAPVPVSRPLPSRRPPAVASPDRTQQTADRKPDRR
jgi:hypothetical protein